MSIFLCWNNYKRGIWTDQLPKALLDMLQFKTQCDFNAKDFEADKVEQYKYIREEMAKIFHDDDKVFFGSVRV